jgi:hypothetical protein
MWMSGTKPGPFVLGASDAFTIGQPITAIIPTSDECCIIVLQPARSGL